MNKVYNAERSFMKYRPAWLFYQLSRQVWDMYSVHQLDITFNPGVVLQSIGHNIGVMFLFDP